MKITWYKVYNYGIERKRSKKKMEMTMVEFHPQSRQLLVDRYEHMNSRNKRWMMRLKVVPLA